MKLMKAFAKGLVSVVRFVGGEQGQKLAAIIPAGSLIVRLVQIIADVERATEILLGSADGQGAKKLEAASPLVVDAIKNSELVLGREIIDEANFVKGCNEVVGGLVRVINSLKQK